MNIKSNFVACTTIACMSSGLFLNSCVSQTSEKTNDDIAVIKFEEAPGSFRLTDYFKDVTCVQLEFTDESILGKIKKIIDVDGELVVLTSDNEVSVFNKKTGKYLRHLGSVGEGPDEFLEAQDMFYNPDQGAITIYDRTKGDFVSYKLSGEFVGKSKSDGISSWMESLERTPDGTMLVCNSLTGGVPPSQYAFTLIDPDGDSDNIDPFAPVTVDGFTAAFAERPMSVCGNELKFVKFLSDTIYSVDNGKASPLYKLSLDNGIVSKKVAAEMHYDSNLISYSINNRKLLGINKMFETTGLIALIPTFETLFGYYWIDKSTGKGYHVESANSLVAEVLPEMNKVIEGRTILNIVGSSESEILSCIIDVESLTQAITENSTGNIMPENVISTIRDADPEGNPVILIYSN